MKVSPVPKIRLDLKNTHFFSLILFSSLFFKPLALWMEKYWPQFLAYNFFNFTLEN